MHMTLNANFKMNANKSIYFCQKIFIVSQDIFPFYIILANWQLSRYICAGIIYINYSIIQYTLNLLQLNIFILSQPHLIIHQYYYLRKSIQTCTIVVLLGSIFEEWYRLLYLYSTTAVPGGFCVPSLPERRMNREAYFKGLPYL